MEKPKATRVSYRNSHYRTVNDIINAIKRIGSINGYRTYVNDDEKMENIIDFMFQRGDNDSVFRLEIDLDKVEDWSVTYDVINHYLKSNNYDRDFDVYDIDTSSMYDVKPKKFYITTGRSNGKHWLEEKLKSIYDHNAINEIEQWITEHMLNIPHTPYKKPQTIPSIEKVIFNDPATIIFWSDGSKTVVKDQGEGYDPEKGMAMAICKKLIGNNEGKYYDEFKKWLPEEESISLEGIKLGEAFSKGLHDAIEDFKKAMEKYRSVSAIDKEDLKKELNKVYGSDAFKDKYCANCKHSPVPSDLPPCCDCINEYEKWEPKEECK